MKKRRNRGGNGKFGLLDNVVLYFVIIRASHTVQFMFAHN